MTEGAVLVTGAAGGIGSALVAALRGRGAWVIGVDQASATPADRSVTVDLGELAHSAERRAAFRAEIDAARGKHPLVGVVNNAALQCLGGVADLAPDDFARMLDVNVVAPLAIAQLCLEDLAASGGRIVNVGSIHAALTKPGFVGYASSKAALSGLTRAMAVDLGSKVRVNAILPAAIETPMLAAGFKDAPEARAELDRMHPVGRIGKPEEVAALVAWLLFDAPDFLTGSLVGLDGAIASRLHDPV